ncbi:RNA helicase [Kineosporia sp. R_H_3]|uniref:DEAD/DEAH box helicase n=1 Tax=Kineosporia sp. R_H_3 TaxID=1961848 RepID=UPI000B4BA461|nr:DEAD/DEAH box helicase [Kineosporia sp. R_H_3]
MSTPAHDPSHDSPAARYAASTERTEQGSTPLAVFRGEYEFDLDPFQVAACEALQDGRGVLVAAPTGSGKTVVGEFAVHLALATGRKAFYTTPIKALSNQKYADLVHRHGSAAVGLLTGDNTINGDAPIVVMTTEVLRNMLYAASSTLDGLGYVVMDEVHYLADRFRGAVWEEVIIHLPDDVLIVSLSATVSNAEEFGAWLDTVRGDTEIVVSEHRPVPLWQHVMVGQRMFDLFADDTPVVTAPDGTPLTTSGPAKVNPELRRLARDDVRFERGRAKGRGGHGGGRGRGQSKLTPSRADVVQTLDRQGLLPAISFIFSRAGCDAAVAQCLAWGLRLTTSDEKEEIRRVVDARCADIPDEDLVVLGYWEWSEALERGIASHHAGLLPTFKEVVEELFTRGLVKVVFATETLALGINMPARSVVLDKLVKWNGETHADVTPGEYTQLTGRAGRRGIDVEGHAVVLWQNGLDPDAVAGLASTRTYPLRSSFRPTYNMAVNLVGQVGRSRAREILETSFAQFQADRAVVGLARQARRQEEALAGYAEAMKCHLGDFTEYARLRRRIADRETDLSRSASRDRRADALASLERLRRGDVIRVLAGRRAGWAVVVDPGTATGADGPRPTVLTADRQVVRLSLADVHSAIEPLTRVPVPKTFNSRNPTSRRDLASTLRNALGSAGDDQPLRPKKDRSPAADDTELNRLRAAMRAHPCHGCNEREDHARWAERWHRLSRETDQLTRRIEGRTNTIARVFDRVCDLLSEKGYLAGDTVTADGERLRRIYAESDLLVSECIREGVWTGLDAPGLAACVSAVVYEARRDDGVAPRMPSPAVREALTETIRIWSALDDHERAHKLDPTPEPDLGIVWAVHRWASGHRLEAVLKDADLTAGDFVRWCKQVVDLLGQVEQGAAAAVALGDFTAEKLRSTARDAVEGVRRGVVAYSSVV